MSPLLSVIIPVYNEEQNIFPLIDRVDNALLDVISYEIIFVDDGSKDGTLERIKEARAARENIYYLSFSRNFGHQNALKAGFENCRGDAVVSLDGDGQHPPELIPQMIAHWQEGCQIVGTERLDSSETGFLKKWTANLFYRIMSLISEIDLSPGAADFRLLDKQVVEAIRKFSEKDLFYRGLVSYVGYRQCNLSYLPGKRNHGVSKYSLKRMVLLALSGVTGFSVFPLRAVTITGFVVAGSSFFYGLYALLIRLFTGQAVSGWASTMAGVYFLGGIQLVALGIFGEYIGKIFLEVKRRPHYLIREAVLPDDSTS